MSELVPVRGPTYDEAVHQRAFLLWMWECDSNIPKTATALAAQEAHDAQLEGREPRKMPDRFTLNRWCKAEDWPAMRHQILVNDDTAGALYNQAIGKLLLLLDKASDKHAQILDLPLTEPVVDREGEIVGEKPSAALPAIYKAIEGVYTATRVMGRADDPEPKLRARRLARVTGTESPEAIAERQRQRMAELKKKRKGKT